MRRRVWVNLLLEKGLTTDDDYVRLLCLDQLRWCGYADRAEQIRAIAARSSNDRVHEMAELVIRELTRADTMPKEVKVACEEGFVPLFNGRDLDGWIGARDSYAAIEPQILDDTDPSYAKLKKEQFHGSVYGVVASAKREDGSSHLKPLGEWNTQEVVVDGTRIKVTLNGAVIVDTDTSAFDPDPKAKQLKDGREHYGLLNRKGHLGWLGHGCEVYWRNVRIRELPGCGKALRGTDRLGIVIDSFEKSFREASDRTYRYGAEFADISLKDLLPGEALDEKAARRVKENNEWLERRLAKREWKVCAVHLDPASADAAIALAAKCGAPFVTVAASASDLFEYKTRCEAKGVTLLLENGGESADELARKLKSLPGVGLAFDPANLILNAKGDPVAAVKTLAPYIRHVRLRDAVSPKASGEAGVEVPWGEGELKAEELFAALDAAGYKGVFAFARLSGEKRVRDLQQAVNWYHTH